MQIATMARLCLELHCTPSQLEQEEEAKIDGLLAYLSARGTIERREAAKAEAMAKLAQRGN